jgi:hypothetical protein
VSKTEYQHRPPETKLLTTTQLTHPVVAHRPPDAGQVYLDATVWVPCARVSAHEAQGWRRRRRLRRCCGEGEGEVDTYFPHD